MLDPRRDRRGQFIPLTAMVTLTSVILLVAVANIYKVSKAKLEAQNLADAVALATAALEAKCINTVVDRNEWLNHMYPAGTRPNEHQVPGISKADGVDMGEDKAKDYAKLIATINKAQMMFAAAYNTFLGADDSRGPTGMNTGPAALEDILREIEGINSPDVQVIVFNNRQGQDGARQIVENADKTFVEANNLNGPSNIRISGMSEIKFKPMPVKLKVGKKPKTLTQLANVGFEVGWMKPDWEVKGGSLDVKTGQTGSDKQLGAGAIVIKRVRLSLFGNVNARAQAMAYVVKNSGVSENAMGSSRPPAEFRPTYYVQLGYR